VFENRVLRGIFRPKRDEVTGGWRKLHNDEFVPASNYQCDQITWNEMGSACSTHGEENVEEDVCLLECCAG
jgi:hypothetical protein